MKRFISLLDIVLVLSMLLLAACGPTPTPEAVEKVVKQTMVVEKEVEVTKEVVVTPTPVPEKKPRVGLLVPDLWWPHPDEMVRAFAEEVETLGAELVFGAVRPDRYLDYYQPEHYHQAAIEILEYGIDVLVLMPWTSEDAKVAVAAGKYGVPVVALDYLAELPGVDLYVAPDYFEVGVWQAEIAQEYSQDGSYLVIRGQGAKHEQIVNGQKEILPDLIEFFPNSPSWLPEAVAEELELQFGEAKQFSAILASNRGYTSGARKWLANTNSDDGAVFLAGSDAWIYNARFLTVDQAAMDVLVDWRELGRVAARAAAQLATGEVPSADRSLSVEGSQIPYLATEVIPIQKDTVYQILVEEQQLYHEAELGNIAWGEIGPEGGVLSLWDGTRLEIPSGALDRSYTITLVGLSPLDRPWGDRTGLAPDLGEGIEPLIVRSVELLPSGLELMEPAILSFHISEGKEDIFPFDEDPGFGLAIYDWQAQSWYPEIRAEGSEINLAERTVAFPIQHFTTIDLYDDFGPFDFIAHWAIRSGWNQESEKESKECAKGGTCEYPQMALQLSEGYSWSNRATTSASLSAKAMKEKLGELGGEISFSSSEQNAIAKNIGTSKTFGGKKVEKPSTGKPFVPKQDQWLKAYTCVFYYEMTIKVYEDKWPPGNAYLLYNYRLLKGPFQEKEGWELIEFRDGSDVVVDDGEVPGCP
jgi:ABC-type xylose transport system substrate-binding protein